MLKDNVICKGQYCSFKKDCARFKSFRYAQKIWYRGERLDVIYLSGIPTSGSRGCHFRGSE